MSHMDRFALKLMHRLDPEVAHNMALKALQLGLVKARAADRHAALRVTIAGLDLPNPLGLAAGFDKNGAAIDPLGKMGFGFIELGATTPSAQPGNPKPRLFRLSQDRAVINRFGFNNHGMAAMRKRLMQRRERHIVGLNLGTNKDSENRARDYAQVISHCGDVIDFATVNVSSPNTENLRDLQGVDALRAVITEVLEARARLPKHIPIFLKVAPDLSRQEIEDIGQLACNMELDAIIATNTTITREGLRDPAQTERGGLSGAPLFEKSNRALARLFLATEGRIPLIGVGGINDAETAYAKLTAGASALQLYSALIYHGMSLVGDITDGLVQKLRTEGHSALHSCIGTRAEEFAQEA